MDIPRVFFLSVQMCCTIMTDEQNVAHIHFQTIRFRFTYVFSNFFFPRVFQEALLLIKIVTVFYFYSIFFPTVVVGLATGL